MFQPQKKIPFTAVKGLNVKFKIFKFREGAQLVGQIYDLDSPAFCKANGVCRASRLGFKIGKADRRRIYKHLIALSHAKVCVVPAGIFHLVCAFFDLLVGLCIFSRPTGGLLGAGQKKAAI